MNMRPLGLSLLVALTTFFALLNTPITASAQVEGGEWEEIGSPQDFDRVLKHFPEGARVDGQMIRMSDGVGLATNVFLPPGDGPWPVIFVKGFYGRFGTSGYARVCKGGDFAFVIQDARGKGDSEGQGTYDPSLFVQHVQDTSEMLDWIAAQDWCNGQIGLYGGSGNGVAPYTAFLSGNPHLTVAAPGNSSGTSGYWMFDNRTRRDLFSWMKNNNMDVSEWPRPTLPDASYRPDEERLEDYTPNADSVLIASGQWYDIVSESVLDAFAAYADQARVFAIVGPGWHGGATEIDGEKWPNLWSRPVSLPNFVDVLADPDSAPTDSFLLYYIMGDPTLPDSAGNQWAITRQWPVPHRATALYLNAQGGLTATAPSGTGSLSYHYDPNDPTPTYGGNASYSIPVGPMDLRPLAERPDVLRFVSEPLSEPLTVVGEIQARLFISTDVPDTQFVVKVFDLRPDGRETIVRESAINARYAEGLNGTRALETGNVYELNLDLWSTAKAFNAGHRIGVYITSSSVLEDSSEGRPRSAEVYEIHPNSFAPVSSMDGAPVARQTLHFSRQYPSAIILPVVETQP